MGGGHARATGHGYRGFGAWACPPGPARLGPRVGAPRVRGLGPARLQARAPVPPPPGELEHDRDASGTPLYSSRPRPPPGARGPGRLASELEARKRACGRRPPAGGGARAAARERRRAAAAGREQRPAAGRRRAAADRRRRRWRRPSAPAPRGARALGPVAQADGPGNGLPL